MKLRDDKGASLAFIAAQNNHPAVLQALAHHQVDLNTPNNEGDNPAHSAAKNSHLDVILMLEQLGAELDLVNDNGLTPYEIAALNGHNTVVKAFILNFGNYTSIKGTVKYNQGHL